LSREKTKGYTGCVECLDETTAVFLNNNKKMAYMGHRWFLPMDHHYRSNKNAFDGTIEKDGPPEYRYGKDILKEVSQLKVVLGKGEGAVPAPPDALRKKKNGFLETTLLATIECTS